VHLFDLPAHRTDSAQELVFAPHGIRVIRTPIRAPQANAYAERFVRSVREECLDWLLTAGRHHLERVLYTYIEYYNRERPHRGLDLSPPQPNAKGRASPTSAVERRDRLGRLLHEYYRAAA